jgi:hypothetical protein
MTHGIRSGVTACCLLGLLALLPPASADVPPDLQRQIDKAIDRGVAHLKKTQSAKGTWSYGHYEAGTTALAAWTLLECGEPPNSPAVQKAVEFVRQASTTLNTTYEVSLAILLFDRLGDRGDVVLIESLAARLLGGQGTRGTWSYVATLVPQGETLRLKAHLDRLAGKRTVPQVLPKERPKSARPNPAKLSPETVQLLRLYGSRTRVDFEGDNSNVQFAALALYVARRYNIPSDEALIAVDRHFRATQNPNGGWAYDPPHPESTASMTCAGLLGLAIAHGLYAEQKGAKEKNLLKDKSLVAGLHALSTVVGDPAPGAATVQTLANGGRSYYFLWTLERMAVIYGMKKINGKDWYHWGAQLIVGNQATDGSWKGEFHEGNCDTCFALLFLKRANVAPELTSIMEKKNKQLEKLPDLGTFIGKDPIKPGIEGGGKQQPAPPDEIDEVSAAAVPQARAPLPPAHHRLVAANDEKVAASGRRSRWSARTIAGT